MSVSGAKLAYHQLLRVVAVVVALVLVFDSGLMLGQTAIWSIATQQHLASVVGVKVGVAPTEVNQLTARITELEGELARRNREVVVNLNRDDNRTTFSNSTFVLSTILFILLVLIVFNYSLDYLRYRELRLRKTVVS